jgi:hypothetical protein
LSHFYIKTNISPRQARDKHRENSKKTTVALIDALQLKLFIVFTGKTYGMKFIELGLPMLKRCSRSKETVTQDDGEEEEAEVGTPGSYQLKDARKAQWKGIDGDFAQMVTQFGYLALFAPACSLAPLLAFINNVTEIRSDAWKLCNL